MCLNISTKGITFECRRTYNRVHHLYNVLPVLQMTSLFHIMFPMAACRYHSHVVHGLTPLLREFCCVLS